MSYVQIFQCDACGDRGEAVIAPGERVTVPEGWLVQRWRPGLINPPGETPKTFPDKHCCGKASCREALKVKTRDERGEAQP